MTPEAWTILTLGFLLVGAVILMARFRDKYDNDDDDDFSAFI